MANAPTHGLLPLLLLVAAAWTQVATAVPTTHNGCACKKDWTATGSKCTDYCCNPNKDTVGSWCQVEDPKCEDSTWGYCGGGAPMEQEEVKSCTDQTPWHDVDGDDCRAYKKNKWCTKDGKVGPGWHTEWGSAVDFKANSFSAFGACCACGGGNNATKAVEAFFKPSNVSGAPRTTFLGCECLTRWSDRGGSCKSSCCNPDKDPAGSWCSVKDPQCQDATWGYCRPTPNQGAEPQESSAPYSERHGHCTDKPKWKDSDGEGCQTYAQNNYCTEVGGYGLGWNMEWGSFEEFGRVTAVESCCACGGGQRDSSTNSAWAPGGGTDDFDNSAKVRTTMQGCDCKKDWKIAGLGSCDNHCCNLDTDEFGAWCMVESETCEDADWGYCQESGLGEVIPRSRDAVHCKDYFNWKDADDDGCAVYAKSRWCTPNGTTGPGWHQEWGKVADMLGASFLPGYMKKNPFSACCACGGGLISDERAVEEKESLMQSAKKLVTEKRNPMWWLVEGACRMDSDGCIQSGGYPLEYSPGEQCQIGVDASKAKPIHVIDFETERQYDVLRINGELYSGSRAPNGIKPTTTIFWGADSKDQKKGWRLCPRGEVAEPNPGILVLKILGIGLLVVLCCCLGAVGGLVVQAYKNQAHGDGLGAGPTKVGKYATQENEGDA